MRTCTRPGCTGRHRARGLCSTHYNQTHLAVRHAIVERACVVCGQPVARRADSEHRTTCSVECRQLLQHGAPAVTSYSWQDTAAKRARDAGALVVEVFDRAVVFERDGWTCYLCSEPVARDASPYDPLSATVDHVVPLSRGGEHSLSNARTAHLGCNSSKQDRPAELVA